MINKNICNNSYLKIWKNIELCTLKWIMILWIKYIKNHHKYQRWIFIQLN
jgi:hypothetical protein